MSSSASSWRKSRANRINGGWVKSISDGFPCLLFSLHRCGGLCPFFSPCSHPQMRNSLPKGAFRSQTSSDFFLNPFGCKQDYIFTVAPWQTKTLSPPATVKNRFPHLLRKSALRRVQGRPRTSSVFQSLLVSTNKEAFRSQTSSDFFLKPFGCKQDYIFTVAPWQTKNAFPTCYGKKAAFPTYCGKEHCEGRRGDRKAPARIH